MAEILEDYDRLGAASTGLDDDDNEICTIRTRRRMHGAAARRRVARHTRKKYEDENLEDGNDDGYDDDDGHDDDDGYDDDDDDYDDDEYDDASDEGEDGSGSREEMRLGNTIRLANPFLFSKTPAGLGAGALFSTITHIGVGEIGKIVQPYLEQYVATANNKTTLQALTTTAIPALIAAMNNK